MINNLVSDALLMPQIYDEIGIAGAYMEELKRQWLKAEQGAIHAPYPTTGRLMARLKDKPQEWEQARWLLGNLPKIPAFGDSQQQPFAIHELFLIKEFLFHYSQLQLFSQRTRLFGRALPDLAPIFTRLDPEGSASPTFRLGPAFGKDLASVGARRLQLEQQLDTARNAHLEKAAAQLEISQPLQEFIVPRSDKKLCHKLNHSNHFALVSESVANLRFRLRDDAASLKILKQLDKLEERRTRAENKALERLSLYLWRQLPRFLMALRHLQKAALHFILADFACRHHCIIPNLGGTNIRIKGAINLPLKQHLDKQGRRYQPIDLMFEARGNLITGPNMGGKSCALQTLGQLARLAQLRVPLPCEKAQLPHFDNIWLNQDDASQGADLSAFGQEVVSFGTALEMPGRTLILLDEFARGTNPSEGEDLLCAVLRYLSASEHFVVAATHFTAPALLSELAQFAIAGPHLEDILQKDIAGLSPTQRLRLFSQNMDYRLKRLAKGKKPPHSAIAVARLLGFDEDILSLINTKG
ncbi:MAG: hypothetical protein GX122_00045 [Candidatus Cloacimonetes bacterium]|nr:hypothetical protein [Candidatus Cloacimonadota bacterium]